jgi:hypothetical protein
MERGMLVTSTFTDSVRHLQETGSAAGATKSPSSSPEALEFDPVTAGLLT